jgi:hypothetical protein
MDLIEFLRARLDEDEAVAVDGAEYARRQGGHEGGANWELAESPEYLTVYVSPARVLREVEADRRLIDEVDEAIEGYEGDLDTAPLDAESWIKSAIGDLRRVLKLRALRFSDHPDYDEAWRP